MSAVPAPSGIRPVFISSHAIDQVMDWPALIAALRATYTLPFDEQVSPPRTFAKGEGASLRALASVPPERRFMGAKVFGRGRNQGMNYLISLAEQDTGEIRALVDANRITSWRTAATSALFVDGLAPRRSLALGVLGSGAEARAHVRAIAAVRPLQRIRVYSPTAANRERFALETAADLGVACEAAQTPRAALAGADIVVGAARSHDESPILHADMLADGMLVVSVGSTLPQQREIDTSVVARCDLIVSDVPSELAHASGDMRAAAKEGIDFEPKLHTLNALLRGEIGRQPACPLFKSVGSAIQDIVAAELAFELTAKAGLAIPLPISFTYKQ